MKGIEKIEPEYSIEKIAVKLAPTAKSHLEHLKFSLTQSIEGEEEVLIARFLQSYFKEYRQILKLDLDPENLTAYDLSFDKDDLLEFKKDTLELIKVLEENNDKRPITSYVENLNELNRVVYQIDQYIKRLEDDKGKDGNGHQERKAA